MHWRPEPPDPGIMADLAEAMPPPRPAPDDYWTRLRPRLDEFGISRVADITGLDHLGFPVAQAVRPAARSNAVTQGKAATLAGAAIGAVLECLEMAAGEDLSRLAPAEPNALESWRALAPGAHWPAADTGFVAAWNISANRTAAVPRDLLSTDFARGAPAEAAPILRHSIGLGAGTSLGAATLHGLWECVEADARIRGEANGQLVRLTPVSADPNYGPLLRRIEARGLRPALWQMPTLPGMHAIKASVMENPGATTLPLPASGYAARAHAPAAVAAALAEAVQARLAVISGAREDITQRFYDHGFSASDLEHAWTDHAPSPSPAVPDDVSRPWTLTSLARAVGPVFVVPLHWDPEVPLAITRVIAPKLIADPLRLEAGQ